MITWVLSNPDPLPPHSGWVLMKGSFAPKVPLHISALHSPLWLWPLHSKMLLASLYLILNVMVIYVNSL